MRRGRRERISKLYCSELEYGLGVSLDKFNLDAFKKDIERIDRSGRLAGGQKSINAVAPARDRSSADYHVHFNCHWTKREFHASLEYYPETESRTPGDTGPFAEEMFNWIGKFFKNANATAHVSVTFSYPAEKEVRNFSTNADADRPVSRGRGRWHGNAYPQQATGCLRGLRDAERQQGNCHSSGD
jgi:hypothetical protein